MRATTACEWNHDTQVLTSIDDERNHDYPNSLIVVATETSYSC